MKTSRQSEKSRFVVAAHWILWSLILAGALSSLDHHAGELRLAYIGPGAGFAFLGSFLTLIAGFFLGLVSFLSWPF